MFIYELHVDQAIKGVVIIYGEGGGGGKWEGGKQSFTLINSRGQESFNTEKG
jgi:hypothetical protein